MARLIPDSAFSDPEMTTGERTLVRKLHQTLEDSCILWYQPKLTSSRRPDLILYLPAIGLILYEVKDWSAGNIIRATADYWEVKKGERIETLMCPFKQAR